jgi:enoyl-CoA hydratase/carnithine racemase
VKLRRDLVQELLAAAADSSCTSIVLRGANHVFCGGADVSEFSNARAFSGNVVVMVVKVVPCELFLIIPMDRFVEPDIRALLACIDALPLPVTAAMEGFALGG